MAGPGPPHASSDDVEASEVELGNVRYPLVHARDFAENGGHYSDGSIFHGALNRQTSSM